MDKIQAIEVRRQALHALFGIAVALIIIFLHKLYASIIIGFGLLLGIFLSYLYKRTHLRFLHSVLVMFEREHDLMVFPGKGPVMMLVGAFAVTLAFDKNIALPAVLVVSLSDAAATAVGIFFGRHRYVHNPNKSLEGTLAFFIIACAITYFFTSAVKTMFVCFIVSIIESANLKPKKYFLLDDNFLVPIVYGVLLYIVI